MRAPSLLAAGSVSNVTVPTLTPYMVPGAKALVIVCPGGAYKWLSWDLEGTSAAGWLNSIGVSAMILKCNAAAAHGFRPHALIIRPTPVPLIPPIHLSHPSCC